MTEQPKDPNSADFDIEEIADRPLECTECRKPIAVWYTEIVANTTVQTCMCQDCPELQKRLQGISQEAADSVSHTESSAGLCCGECGTKLSSIRMGHPMGCAECYQVFSDVILQELITSHKVPLSLANKSPSGSLHVGHKPGQTIELSPSLQLIALNEALKEALGREDYEQAAWLRDQIKDLTGSSDPHDKEATESDHEQQ